METASQRAEAATDEPVEILEPEPDPTTAERLRDLDERIRTVVAERPVTSVLVAVAVGFAMGRALRRWT